MSGLERRFKRGFAAYFIFRKMGGRELSTPITSKSLHLHHFRLPIITPIWRTMVS